MSVTERIIQQIEKLSAVERKELLKALNEKYFSEEDRKFIVGENYDFWLNEQDNAYDALG
ncbi:hypothetical protein [Bacillus horti]|uniref:BH0509 family protein n=1 Tax=Caldalkalibacillus horti TaxID=77523 RepID=A0ABT9VV88_9BACI|nr:hypothetical protein [Bacillus horti]MDQ0164891.1 hypothetical protein [Bacillus horti]